MVLLKGTNLTLKCFAKKTVGRHHRKGGRAEYDYKGKGHCRFCGCTEERDCPGGCAWATEDKDLCTNCVDKVKLKKDFMEPT